MNQIYKPSGKFNPVLLPACIIVATLLSMLVTAIAAWIGIWIYPPYVGMVMVALTAFISHWFYNFAIAASHTRNKAVSRIAILVSSLLVVYYHLASVIAVLKVLDLDAASIDPGLYIENAPVLLLMPFTMLGDLGLFIEDVKQVFIGSGAPWLVYLAIIALTILLFPQTAAKRADQPYSEERGRWMKKAYSVGRFEFFDDSEMPALHAALEQGDISPLLNRPRNTRHNSAHYAFLTFYKIGKEQSGYVGVENASHRHIRGNEYNANEVDYKDVIPPINIGMEKAQELEQSINASAVMNYTPFSNQQPVAPTYATQDSQPVPTDTQATDGYAAPENLAEEGE
ncbi:MAG: hypothetical protein ACK5LX_10695, partial [Oscillospiraceae bacterium]